MLLRNTSKREWWQLMIQPVRYEECMRKQTVTHSYTVLLECGANTCEVEWEIAHVHIILGTPPVPSPLTPRPLAQFPVPCLPHWEPLPLFLYKPHSLEKLGLRTSVFTVPPCNRLHQLNRRGQIMQPIHTQTRTRTLPVTHNCPTETNSKQRDPSSDLLVTATNCIN